MNSIADEPVPQESFADFRASFAYGARSDQNFKFLKNLSEADAATFLQGLLHALSDSLDDGAMLRLYQHVLAGQVQAYAGPSRWTYEDGPFTPLAKPLDRARVALLTSSGHFVDGDDPRPFGSEALSQQEAEARIDDFLKEAPVLSAIPVDTPTERLRVRHGGYDVRGAQRDPNVTFPLALLRELRDDGMIGALASPAYSFVGACAQTPLLKQTGPQWVGMFQAQAIDGVVLVPV